MSPSDSPPTPDDAYRRLHPSSLLFAIISSFQRGFSPPTAGLTIGLMLALIHLISIPVDNTSVNPARSIAMAVFAGGDAIEQLWAFIVFPLLAGSFLFEEVAPSPPLRPACRRATRRRGSSPASRRAASGFPRRGR